MCMSSNCSILMSSSHLVHRDVATEAQPASSEGAWQKALQITPAWQARSVETCCPQRLYYRRVDSRCQQRRVQIVFKERRAASEWSNGQKSRCSCFCPIFNQAAGSLLSCPLAHWNCVTDISYTRFLTSVHRRIQPAQPHGASTQMLPPPPLPQPNPYPSRAPTIPEPPTSSIHAKAHSLWYFCNAPAPWFALAFLSRFIPLGCELE